MALQRWFGRGLENVVIIRLPPYSPELNPIEQVWNWLRQHNTKLIKFMI
ncbi:transposase [Pseudoalteromonas rubra]